MASSELFWTYWLPHYAGIVWQRLFASWLLLTPVALLLMLWPRYAVGSRRWLGALNHLLAFGSLLWVTINVLEFLVDWYSQVEFVQYCAIRFC